MKRLQQLKAIFVSEEKANFNNLNGNLSGNGGNNKNPSSKQIKELKQKTVYELLKKAFIILLNPTILRTIVKQLIQKWWKISLTRSTLKKIPIIGGITGISFRIWRTLKGEYKRAALEVLSGIFSSTLLGIYPLLAVDIMIVASDIQDQILSFQSYKKVHQ